MEPSNLEVTEHAHLQLPIRNAPLIISSCVGSCGCTVPTWSRDPIAPGGSTKITVKYDTQRAGTISKTVTITSNAVNTPKK